MRRFAHAVILSGNQQSFSAEKCSVTFRYATTVVQTHQQTDLRYCLRQNSELRCIVSQDVQVVTDASLAKTDRQETVQITEGQAKYSSVDFSTGDTPKRSTVASIFLPSAHLSEVQ